MSRIAKAPVAIPKGVDINVSGQTINAKGPKGQSSLDVHHSVEVVQEEGSLSVKPRRDNDQGAIALAGTMRSLLNNLVIGVSEGFQKKLELRGVGYRAQAQGTNLNITVGYSHPIVHKVPEGITVETPSQTEIIVSGISKQVVGQVAADIRSYRPPEPYKGKGIRYVDEYVAMKEAKKK